MAMFMVGGVSFEGADRVVEQQGALEALIEDDS